MTVLESIVREPGVARLGLALVHFAWQGAAIAGLLALLLAALRDRRPQARSHEYRRFEWPALVHNEVARCKGADADVGAGFLGVGSYAVQRAGDQEARRHSIPRGLTSSHASPPLMDPLATYYAVGGKRASPIQVGEWAGLESNQRPRDYESPALTD